MVQTQKSFARLYQTKFVTEVTLAATKVQALVKDKNLIKVEAEFVRIPDEHEFYLLSLGKAIVEVLTSCEYLENIPVLLKSYRETAALKQAGMNRQRYIVYHVENYIIRVQGLYDRIIKLLNAVFHLLNDSRNCREHVILQNLKVKHHQEVLDTVKRLSKLLNKYAADRNEVIHEASFQEDDLRLLEMYCIAEKISAEDKLFPQRDFPALIRELSEEIINKKKSEFSDFNNQLANLICELMDLLHPRYINEERSLRFKLNKS